MLIDNIMNMLNSMMAFFLQVTTVMIYIGLLVMPFYLVFAFVRAWRKDKRTSRSITEQRG